MKQIILNLCVCYNNQLHLAQGQIEVKGCAVEPVEIGCSITILLVLKMVYIDPLQLALVVLFPISTGTITSFALMVVVTCNLHCVAV